MTVIVFNVNGMPAPQGSKKGFRNQHTGRIQMVESSKKVKPWRSDVRDAAEKWRADNGYPALLDGPLTLHVDFRLPRPASTPKKVRHPFRQPDLSKLIRSTEDALKGLVWVDDARVVHLDARKVFCGPDEVPGCTIVVGEAS